MESILLKCYGENALDRCRAGVALLFPGHLTQHFVAKLADRWSQLAASGLWIGEIAKYLPPLGISALENERPVQQSHKRLGNFM